jgi:hypothetical protein
MASSLQKGRRKLGVELIPRLGWKAGNLLVVSKISADHPLVDAPVKRLAEHLDLVVL